jgi:ABC-type branched-subunit amino acid transport system substrate-binding protein
MSSRPWSSHTGLRSFGVVAVVLLALSWINFVPSSDSGPKANGSNVVADDGPVADGTSDGGPVVDGATGDQAGGAGTGPAKQATGSQGGTGPAAAGVACERGKNGGATDKGVTATEIKIASTAVLDGPARSLLADSVTGMKAVVDKVNRSGGICGRILTMKIVNDSFSDSDGLRILRNFMEEGQFALPVVPSAEGLGAAIQGGWIGRAGIPVIGSDGMRQEQYNDPWVWPVASATVTAMRVMAKYGLERKGAKTFGIVWDTKYKFGREGKDAFVKQVQALGGTVVTDQALNPDLQSYASEANEWNSKCGGAKCDMVAMLLLPDTAEKWMVRQPALGGKYTSGAQTLFTDAFAQKCVQAAGVACNGIAVWTGYNPPIGEIASLPGVASYVNDVRALNPSIDVNNQFLEGSYLGMTVFVEALRKAGPTLTRARLREVMDNMDYRTDLTSPLSWRAGKHTANVRSQSFAMVVSQGTFTGWRNENTDFLLDPAFGG